MNDLGLRDETRALLSLLVDRTGRGLIRWEHQPERYVATVGDHRVELVVDDDKGEYELTVFDSEGHPIDHARITPMVNGGAVASEQFEQVLSLRASAKTRRDHMYGDIREHLDNLGASSDA